ncbi:MAG: isoprenoid biosynthesis glyoxalase ElbB [Alphaproteobacteria bacterium]|nr:isoprenoid biosynthesis glyoxalase ElbB [Alphaproteobacteria bacterium]
MSNKKKIAVVLSGCGAKDGSEIHEAVMTLLAIDRQDAFYQCFAPDIKQHNVINHITDEEMNEDRNVMVEAARICRGDIKPLVEYDPADYDALILPGGFGAAKTLFTLAIDGQDFIVNDLVERAIKSTYDVKKPIGALCIAPVMIARLLSNVKVTIGQNKEMSSLIEKFSSYHEKTNHGEICIDRDNKIVTSPCYMLDARISDIAQETDSLVKAILELS